MSTLDEIVAKVVDFIDSPGGGPSEGSSGDRFAALVLEVFDFQYRENPPYRAFCDRRGRTPKRIESWRDIPSVPATAFKALDLVCAQPERIFLTSGTTGGAEHRGRHLVPRLELYRRSALAHFTSMVLVDGMRPRLICLLGDPALLPHSSLTQMVEWIRTYLCAADGEYLVDSRGFDPERAARRIESAARDGKPLCLIGLRVVFTALLDHLRLHGQTLMLPPDSRIVDTGGSKGGRALSDAGFLAACWSSLGVPGYYCITEYGMTELCSQFYDNALAARFAGSNSLRRKLGPRWTRTIAVDPTNLEPVPDGTPGLLCHYDLANAGSVIAVQTEDLGVIADPGTPGGVNWVEPSEFQLLGRVHGAEPRGCALALAELLGSAAASAGSDTHAGVPPAPSADALPAPLTLK